MYPSQDCEPTEEDKAYSGWKHLIPFRSASKDPKTLPLVSAGPLNYATIHWMNDLILRAYRKDLTQKDLYDTPWKDSADENSDRFEKIWNEEVAKHGEKDASVSRAIFTMIRTRLICAAVLTLTFSGFAILGPAVPMRILTDFLSLPEEERPSKLYLLGMDALLVFCQLTLTFFVSAIIPLITANAGIRVRGGVLSLVFKKILSRRSLQTQSVGELINLCANDGQRLFDASMNGVFAVGFLVSLGGAAYSIHLLGIWGLLGFGVFFLFIPVQIGLSKLVFNYRCKAIPITEKRVNLMSEIVTAIKLVKMYAWEKPFSQTINDIRTDEKYVLESSLLVQSILATLPQLIPQLATAVTFLTMTLCNVDLSITQAFVFLSLLNSLVFTLGIIPFSMKSLAEGSHACDRVKAILIAEEEQLHMSPRKDRSNLVEITKGYFGWEIQEQYEDGTQGVITKYGSVVSSAVPEQKEMSTDKSTEREPLLHKDSIDKQQSASNISLTLHDITMSLKEGTLLGVCGAVGSGKTSIIQAILGMMKMESGEIALDQSKKIAYVSQQAWIMNTTVKENIIFGNALEQKRYDRVVEACALLADFDQLPAGDQTEIGERGINLSGGQKQRISIARAVYSDSDLILLDDPLSAVDAHVGQHIFTNCLKDLLKNKTVLFVTHQLQFLNGCDYILVMKDGRIAEEGTHETLMRDDNGEYSNLIKSFHDAEGEDGLADLTDVDDDNVVGLTNMRYGHNKWDMSSMSSNPESVSSDKECEELENLLMSAGENKSPGTSGELTLAEDMKEERVEASTYSTYIRAAGGFCITTLVFIVVLIAVSIQAFSSYWLSVWIDAGGVEHVVNITQQGGNVSVIKIGNMLEDSNTTAFYQIIYGTSVVTTVIAALIKSWSYVKTSLRASSNLHDKIFRKLVASPMRFFDVTPSGQILNRFSKDMDEVDSMLPFLSEQLLYNAFILLITFIIIALVFPFFLLAMIPVVIIFLILYKISQRGIQCTKRIDNITRSPLYSHIAATMQGLSTIKAYEKEEQFHSQFNKLQDQNNMAYFLFHTGLRWAAVRLDSLSVLVVCITSLFVTFVPSSLISPSLAALALSYSMNVSGLFQHTMRLAVETQARFTSVQRLKMYIDNLESEAPPIVEGQRPDSEWPKEGAIKFDNVDVRYKEGLPLVLKSISLDIKPQEKIGIVGRTGSGKSSLAMVLFRMMELDGGSITIDNIDISTIGLEDLRSKLSIIPQDPVLFVGTVRYNLDPFHTYTDDELWEALTKCHVKHTIKALDGQLDATIVENGENFSVGERQLLCMARALLRHSKILLLDEATAAIDTETDSLIQDTIKEAFADCTMLTIAHRLNTVANYDKILVLDDGKVVEFDAPGILLSNKGTQFSQMMTVQENQKLAALHKV